MSFNLIADNLQAYCDQNTSAASPNLQALDRHTHANILQPRMLSGHFQGRLLSMISCMVKPKYILEIGTYTGYSAICLAEGLQADGKLITESLKDYTKTNLQKEFASLEMTFSSCMYQFHNVNSSFNGLPPPPSAVAHFLTN